MRKKFFDTKRIIVTFMLICILTTTLLSIGFIISHAKHDCVGENCPICVQINDCLNTLSRITGICCSICMSFGFSELMTFNRSRVEPFSQRKSTLVGLKVRMNN